ncbi:response regulator [Ancylothrix sp. C2]|uniref:response regulator n=1 Tax=Ancylothrix sp. D3o TaxID=2953691 RepID=UPI0021BB2359|nr:response regulator [Ancylothrix sp. D3o]MCT7951009.1 response regulator [Ancylothrix sp. D3o]
MTTDAPGCANLTKTLAELSAKCETGKLTLLGNDRQWHLYFILGRLVHATGGDHRVRRWYRATKQCCPDFTADFSQISGSNLWEYQLLQKGISQAKLSLYQAKAVIGSILREVFFTILAEDNFTCQWSASFRQPTAQKLPSLPLSCKEVEQVLQKTKILWQQWQEMGLSHLAPDQAPILLRNSGLLNNPSTPQTILSLSQLFNGQNTLWDLALRKKQSVTVLTRTLHYFVGQGIIEVRTVPDLASPMEQLRLVENACKTPKPLIACIDDSPVVCASLEAILVPAGYRVLKIQDPLRQMSNMVEQEPALIFMDLIMPDPTGYALCSFLRKTSVFRNTPIVILTGYDGMVERARTKFTGATDFLSKPPEPKKVLAVVQKHLKANSASPLPFTGRVALA